MESEYSIEKDIENRLELLSGKLKKDHQKIELENLKPELFEGGDSLGNMTLIQRIHFFVCTFEANPNWIISGKGSMFVTSNNTKNQSKTTAIKKIINSGLLIVGKGRITGTNIILGDFHQQITEKVNTLEIKDLKSKVTTIILSLRVITFLCIVMAVLLLVILLRV